MNVFMLFQMKRALSVWLILCVIGSRLGAQFKAIIEYALSQRVPKPCSRKDSR